MARGSSPDGWEGDWDVEDPVDATMPDTLSPVETESESRSVVAISVATAAPARTTMRHVLEFEKPLARLEQQISELEALQATKGVDYTKELRQLRANYTALLRKTYEHLSAWETVKPRWAAS